MDGTLEVIKELLESDDSWKKLRKINQHLTNRTLPPTQKTKSMWLFPLSKDCWRKLNVSTANTGPAQRSNHIKLFANYLSPPKTRHPTKRNLASFIAIHVKDVIKFIFSRVDKQRNEPGRWKSRIVAIFLLFLTLLHVLT